MSAEGTRTILDEVQASLALRYGAAFDTLRVERLVIGIHFVGVKLSNGEGGVAYMPPDLIQRDSNRILKKQHFRVKGALASLISAGDLEHPFAPVIRLATLNALSAPFIQRQDYLSTPSEDITTFRFLFENRRVCLVGAIIPILKRIRPWVSQITIIDRKKETEVEADGIRFVPTEGTQAALGDCDTVVITGAAVANGSISELLTMIPEKTFVALAGPSAGFIPDPLFERGVSLVGTSVVSDIDQALDILSEGGGAYQLFGRGVHKINLINPAAIEFR